MTRIEKLEDKLFNIECDMQGVKTRNITEMPKGGKPLTMDDLLIKKEETEHRIQFLINKSREIRLEIYDCIDQLEDDRFAEVLEYYFIDCLTFEDIADKKCYSVRHVGYLYGRGLDVVPVPSVKE